MSCNNDSLTSEKIKLREKEIELKEKELLLKEKEINIEINSRSKNNFQDQGTNDNILVQDTIVGKNKYLFVTIVTYEPEIKEREIVKESGSKYSGGLVSDPIPEYEKYVVPQYHKYFSDIIEIHNYNEDNKYQQIDKFEKSVRSSLQQINFNLYMVNNRGMAKPVDDIEAKIISKEAFTFDSYKAASQRR